MQLSSQQEIRILHVDDEPSVTDLTEADSTRISRSTRQTVNSRLERLLSVDSVSKPAEQVQQFFSENTDLIGELFGKQSGTGSHQLRDLVRSVSLREKEQN